MVLQFLEVFAFQIIYFDVKVLEMSVGNGKWSNGKWTQDTSQKSQGKFFLSFLCTLFLYFLRPEKF